MQHRKSLGIVMTVVLGMTCAGHSSSLADVAQKRRPAVLRAAIPVLSILKDGMKQWLNGATVQESLGAWEVVGAERAHASLKSAGVKSIELIGMEFELILMRDKQPVYYVRSFISANRRGPKLMHLTGASGAPFVKGHPLEAWTGPTTPLRTP